MFEEFMVTHKTELEEKDVSPHNFNPIFTCTPLT
jgi:hypothetical protein